MNDIGNSCHGMILSFADDTTLITSSSNLNELFTNANVYINNLYEWFCSNRLSLNANKQNILFYDQDIREKIFHNIIFILEILSFLGLEMTVLKHPPNFLECISMRI